MNAQEWLEQVGKLDQLINAKLAERDRLKDMATDISPKPMDGMPFDNTGVVPRKMENAVVRLIDLANELNRLVDEYIDCKQKVVKALEQLPENEYGVLHRHYIRFMTWEQVAEDMGFCTVQVWRIKKKALKNLQNVIECNVPKV